MLENKKTRNFAYSKCSFMGFNCGVCVCARAFLTVTELDLLHMEMNGHV